MCTAGFPEPMTFSLRAARHLLPRAAEFDVVHDNQSLGCGLLRLVRRRAADGRDGAPPDRHRPASSSSPRRPVAAPAADAAPLVRVHRHAGAGGRAGWTASPPSRRTRRRDIATHMGLPRRGRRGHPGRHRSRRVHPAAGRTGPRDPDSILVITSADVAAQGPGAPARGAGQAAHRAAGAAHRRRHRAPRRPGGGGAGPAGAARRRPLHRAGARGRARRAAAAGHGRGHPLAVRGLLAARHRGDGLRAPRW